MDFVANSSSDGDLASDINKQLNIAEDGNDDDSNDEEEEGGAAGGKKKKKKKKRSKKKAIDIEWIPPVSRVLGGSTNYFVKYGQTNPPTIPVSFVHYIIVLSHVNISHFMCIILPYCTHRSGICL
jgi:hypothetical protein